MQQLASVAKFRNGLFALVDDYEELREERRKAKAEERERREREQNEEKERGRGKREIEALRAKLDEAQQSLAFLQKERQETQQLSALAPATQQESLTGPQRTEVLQELKSQNLELEASLEESTQKSLSLQRCLEGKCAIIEAMSKEIRESQELLTRGWEELGDTKKQVCDLAQSQYDTIRRLKQLESELKKRVDCNLELERTIEEERKERKELSQAKAEMDWQLSSYQKQVSALSECNEKLERVLRDKESAIEEQARLAFRGQQITSTVQELQNYVGMETAQCNDFLQLHLVIKI